MYACLWWRATGPVNRMCTVGKWCLSGRREGGERVKTLIGREKSSCITVELWARTGKIKGRERGETVRKTHTHTHTSEEKKSSSYKEIGRIATSECTAGTGRQVKWKNQQGGKIGGISCLLSAFVLTSYYTLQWARCHLVCVCVCGCAGAERRRSTPQLLSHAVRRWAFGVFRNANGDGRFYSTPTQWRRHSVESRIKAQCRFLQTSEYF